MKEFHFSKIYFRALVYDDSGVRVVVDEKPSINLTEEEYSLRITTRYEDVQTVHRNYAIEHHLPPSAHAFPHLQYRFHTEEIGQFRLRIDVKNEQEYKDAVLGFIFKTMVILEDLEKHSEGITQAVINVALVSQLKNEGDLLSHKIAQGIEKYGLDFDRKRKSTDSFERLRENPLLLNFIGEENLTLMEKKYQNMHE